MTWTFARPLKLAAALLMLAACAPAQVKPAPKPVLLGVAREPFVEWGETGVNATVNLANDGGPGLVLTRVSLRYAGQTWTHERALTLAAGERRSVPVRFPEPAFATRVGTLALRAAGAAAVTAVAGPGAFAVGATLAGQLGLSGADALADLLDLNASATVALPEAGAVPPAGPAFSGLSLSDPGGADTGAGLLVSGVRGNSPASTAGLQARERNLFGTVTRPGDLITAVNGQPLPSLASWSLALAGVRPGDLLRLTVRRGDQTLPVTLVTGDAREYGLAGAG